MTPSWQTPDGRHSLHLDPLPPGPLDGIWTCYGCGQWTREPVYDGGLNARCPHCNAREGDVFGEAEYRRDWQWPRAHATWTALTDQWPPEGRYVRFRTAKHGDCRGERHGNTVRIDLPDAWGAVVTHWQPLEDA
jgi:hypothetical protein